MKKVFNSLFVIIAAMVTFAGCQKEENNAPAAQTNTVEFFANSIETKTVFGESYTEGTDTKYPTLWSAGDKVKVYLNLSIPSGTSGTEKSSNVELLEGTETSASAKFKAEIVDYSPESYTFYAVSPSDAANARTSSRVTVVIPTLQKPLATSPAKDAQIVYAISETTEEMPSSIDMDFHHFTAYGKLSFSNLASTSVSKVKIVAPADVCLSGKWNYLPADGTLAPHSEGTSNEITIETTSTSDIWFACGPVDVSSKTLKFIVTTDDGNLEKEITFPANRKFQSGKVAKFTVDMDGIVPPVQETTKCYKKVTESQSDWTGTYLIVYEDGANAYVFNAIDAANGYLSATISDGTIASTSETDAVQVQIESMNGGYAIKSSKGYIYGKSNDNKLNFNSTTQQLNKIDYESTGVKIVSLTSVLRFNSTSGQMRFRYYKSSSYSSQQPVQLYKLVDGESGGETPEQPETPAAPVLTITEKPTSDIAAEGDVVAVKYSVTNPVEGKSVTASANQTWVNNFDYSVDGEVSFIVDENTGAERTATVTLAYEGATPQTVTINQAAAEQGGGTIDPVTIDVIFSNYTAGTQYAKNETHKINDDLTIYVNDGHFTTELRLYDSNSNNTTAWSSELPGYISGMTFNAGYKAATLKVYGSSDGTTWTEVGTVTTKSSYNDYVVNFTLNAYKYFKLDAVGAQIRIKRLGVTYQPVN